MVRSKAGWCSAAQGLEAQARQTPGRAARSCGDQHLSHRTLNRRASRLGFFLQAMGVKTEVPVGICLPRWPGLDCTFRQHQPQRPAAPEAVASPAPRCAPEALAPEIPVAGARLGRDADGTPAWFGADPKRTGKDLRVEIK